MPRWRIPLGVLPEIPWPWPPLIVAIAGLALLAGSTRAEPGAPAWPAPAASPACKGVSDDASTADTVRWTVCEDLSIGMIDGPEAYRFQRIRGVLVSDRGEIVVLEAGDGTIRVFSPEGAFVRQFGGRGNGRAEFQTMIMGVLKQDTLHVFDLAHRKVVRFDLEGRLIDTVRLPLAIFDHGIILRADPLPDGNYLLQSLMGCGLPLNPERHNRRYLLLLSADGARLESVHSAPITPEAKLDAQDFWQCIRAQQPYGRYPRAGVAPDGRVAYGDAERFEIWLYRIDPERPGLGEPEAWIRLDRPVVPDTAADRSAAREPTLERAAALDARARGYARAVRDALDHDDGDPRTWSAYLDLRFDDAGRLWAQRPRSPADRDSLWELFDGDGRHLGTVAIPVGLDVQTIRQNGIYGVVRDEYGVLYVKRYRLCDPPGRATRR